MHNWYGYFVTFYWLIQMEAYIRRGHFIDNLKYDWLMVMVLDGIGVECYHVTLSYIK